MHLARRAFDGWEVGVARSPLWHLACLRACSLALAALEPPAESAVGRRVRRAIPGCGALRWCC